MRDRRRIPFGTISIPERSRELIRECLDNRRISGGKYVREFEERFAALHGVREAVAVSSGTDADTLALAVLHDYGARRGDEIIVPALSFIATGNAVFHAGFTPVFVDVRRDTLNIDPALIDGVVTDRTRAILAVHLMGKPAEMERIREVAGRHGLRVIEDAAEAHGARYRGRPVGGLADMAAFSLYIAHIITTGEGGIVTTDDEAFAEILRSLRAHGRGCNCRVCILSSRNVHCEKRFSGPGGEDRRFISDRIGYSCKMNELEAAIGLGYMDEYERVLARRRDNLHYLMDRFDRFRPFLDTIREEEGEAIGPHAFPIVVQEPASFNRTQLAAFLEERGIDTRTLFGSIPTQNPAYGFMGHRLGEFPRAEYIGSNGIHIGIHQDLNEEDMDYVLRVLEEFLARHQS